MSPEVQGRLVGAESAADTEALGAELARALEPGDLVLIEGEVGAGKTTMVRGICRALGVTERVTSPTFTIGHLYSSPGGPVAHLDLYRIADTAREDPALLDDYLTRDAIGLVEWPAAGGEALRQRAAIVVEIRHSDRERREVLIRRPAV